RVYQNFRNRIFPLPSKYGVRLQLRSTFFDKNGWILGEKDDAGCLILDTGYLNSGAANKLMWRFERDCLDSGRQILQTKTLVFFVPPCGIQKQNRGP
ncbi:MAG: hypothetical protein Q8S39_08815, partial [Ignavibacteria bacterium]|nr:hypothetical protein [Ignavibacteria bacterium]